ncbi:MAG: hypothetical protein ACR2OF_00695 [Hyphomicrobium sp.]
MTDVRTLFRWVGGAITVVSTLFAFAFGLSLSSNGHIALVVAIVFACAAIGSAFIWPFVADALGKRRWVHACFIALFAVLFTGTDVVTNFGSISWQRGMTVQSLEVESACNDNACGKQAENQKTLKLWEDRRARLLAEKPWLATVSTEALRDDLVRSSEAILKESSRGGCGPICRRLKLRNSELSTRFAAAEQFSDISKSIAATRRKIASARNASANPDEAAAPALLQNAALEHFFKLARNPSEISKQSTDQSAIWVIAALLTLAAVGANYLGWWGIGTGTRFGSHAPPAAPDGPRIKHPVAMIVGRPSLTRLALAGIAMVILGAATVAVFDRALGWQGLLFSAPIVFLLGSGAAWWIAEVDWPPSGDAD